MNDVIRTRWLCALVAIAPACVKAPAISVVDNKTALEAQAAGEFHELDNELSNAALSPRAEPIPREQLAATPELASESELGEIAELEAGAATDDQWVDDMLVAGCIGEALTALLEPTPDHCRADVDTATMTRVLGRANLHRRQVWQLIGERRPEASADEVRETWRTLHLQRVVCGGLVQVPGGTWEPKSC